MSLESPLGVFLAGGGALGNWQAGAAHRLFVAEKLPVASWMGFSAGALNAAVLASGRGADLPEAWRGLTPKSVLRLSPRFGPFTLFSPEPLREQVARWVDEAAIRRGPAPLRVVSSDYEARLPVVAEFSASRWDGPLAQHLEGSAAIPRIFPPADTTFEGGPIRLVDGGVWAKVAIPGEALADGAGAVLLLNMVLESDLMKPARTPLSWLDRMGRAVTWLHMSALIGRLAVLREGTPVYHLMPSRALDHYMLDFDPAKGKEAYEQGERDAEAFLRDPSAFRVGGKAGVGG